MERPDARDILRQPHAGRMGTARTTFAHRHGLDLLLALRHSCLGRLHGRPSLHDDGRARDHPEGGVGFVVPGQRCRRSPRSFADELTNGSWWDGFMTIV